MLVRATRNAWPAALGLALAALPAHATNGYFAHGYGTHQKGMAGAGAALCTSALAPAANPAALACVGDRLDVGLAVFNPNRRFSVTGLPSGLPGTFGLVSGSVESDSRYFPIPNLGVSRRVGQRQSLGLAVYGNGGMNTDYPVAALHGGKPTGVDLSQLFVTPTWAVELGPHALGVSAILAA